MSAGSSWASNQVMVNDPPLYVGEGWYPTIKSAVLAANGGGASPYSRHRIIAIRGDHSETISEAIEIKSPVRIVGESHNTITTNIPGGSPFIIGNTNSSYYSSPVILENLKIMHPTGATLFSSPSALYSRELILSDVDIELGGPLCEASTAALSLELNTLLTIVSMRNVSIRSVGLPSHQYLPKGIVLAETEFRADNLTLDGKFSVSNSVSTITNTTVRPSWALGLKVLGGADFSISTTGSQFTLSVAEHGPDSFVRVIEVTP